MESGPKFPCPLCSYEGTSPELVTVHVNRAHSSPVRTSKQPPAVDDVDAGYHCPVCGERFDDDVILRHHVDEHFSAADSGAATRPGDGSASAAAVPPASGTPGMAIWVDEDTETAVALSAVLGEAKREATAQCMHCTLEVALSVFSDHLAAHEIAQADGEQLLQRQQAEAAQEEELKVKYGMDSSGGYSSTYQQRLSGDADRQRISGLEYHHQRALLAERMALGVDSNATATRGLIPALTAIYRSNTIKLFRSVSLCCDITHYSGDRGDGGWGCGYRNLQMMMSSLMSVPEYRRSLVRAMPFLEGKQVPSVPKIQELIEAAWQDGFDPAGAEQLNRKLCGTRKWIGSTEVAALLRFCGIRALLVDFHRPTGPNGTHPALFEWVSGYFGRRCPGNSAQRVLTSAADFRPPVTSATAATSSLASRQQSLPSIHAHPDKSSLYFQHQGHSRTVIGVEERSDSSSLLILDPSHPPRKMATLLPNTSSSASSSEGVASTTTTTTTTTTTSSAVRHAASHASSAAGGGTRSAAAAGVPSSRLQVVCRAAHQLTARQYQVVYADGVIADGDVTGMKTLSSSRIP